MRTIKIEADNHTLTAMNAIFSVKTYNNKVFIGSARDCQVLTALNNYLKKALTPEDCSLSVELCEALFKEPVISVALITKNISSEKELYKKKYEAIYQYKSYNSSYGYNTLTNIRSSAEKREARHFRERLYDDLELLYGEGPSVKDTRAKKVGRYNERGLLIKEYDSCVEAARLEGLSQGNISACCTGKLKTVNGAIWKYID